MEPCSLVTLPLPSLVIGLLWSRRKNHRQCWIVDAIISLRLESKLPRSERHGHSPRSRWESGDDQSFGRKASSLRWRSFHWFETSSPSACSVEARISMESTSICELIEWRFPSCFWKQWWNALEWMELRSIDSSIWPESYLINQH